MPIADRSTIERLRRAMPRNQDAMDVCEAADAGLIAIAAAKRAPEIVGNRCVICAERRETNKAAMKAGRAKKKAAPAA